MSHFAKVEGGIVTQVIVVEQDVLDTGLFGDPSLWKQTSYNTRGGIHYDPITNEPDDKPAMRGNYAGIGYIYDSELDVFYPPKPFDSWTLNSTTFLWESPVPYPTDGKLYDWDEETINWKLIETTT